MNLTRISKQTLTALTVILAACSGSEYSKLVKREMATGVINDSLLFDLKLGQSKDYFFQSCWKLNQQQLISHGPGSNTVKYSLPTNKNDSTALSMTLLFFGDFNDDRIMTGMDLQFYYNAWSIWNKSLQADQLLPVVMDTLNKWYPGNDFIKVSVKDSDSLYLLVKVDGNRRITIPPITHEKIVKAKIDDLRYVLDEKQKK